MADFINQTNLIAKAHTGAYEREVSYSSNKTVIFFSQGFMVQAHVSSVLFRSASVSIDIYYRQNNQWVYWRNVEKSKSGAGSDSSQWYGINMDGIAYENIQRPTCIFKAVFSGSASGSASWEARFKQINIGTVCNYNNSWYNAYAKSHPILYADNDYWSVGGTYSTEQEILNARSPGNFRGDPITDSLARHCAVDTLNY